jgi:hypothetical protein
LTLSFLSNGAMKAHNLSISDCLVMPANAILVPGLLALGALMYSLNSASIQVVETLDRGAAALGIDLAKLFD